MKWAKSFFSFIIFLFQGPKLEPLKEDTLASTYKSVSQHLYKTFPCNTHLSKEALSKHFVLGR